MLKFTEDGGHGGFGVTPGKRVPDGSMYEWDFNGAVAAKVKNLLAQYKDVAVLRVDDPTGKTDVALGKRTDQINGWGSQFHLSIHANAAGDGWSSAHGIETFAYKAGTTSHEIAKKVQKALVKATGLTDRGVKTANFHMLRETKCPAILVECGFMSNKEEAALLKSDAYRTKIANAIVGALAEHFKLVKVAPTPPKKPVETGTIYRVQVGAFSDRANAEKLLKELTAKGYKGVIK
jgi:N-acetylmuramoyl-L-alanine amidase